MSILSHKSNTIWIYTRNKSYDYILTASPLWRGISDNLKNHLIETILPSHLLLFLCTFSFHYYALTTTLDTYCKTHNCSANKHIVSFSLFSYFQWLYRISDWDNIFVLDWALLKDLAWIDRTFIIVQGIVKLLIKSISVLHRIHTRDRLNLKYFFIGWDYPDTSRHILYKINGSSPQLSTVMLYHKLIHNKYCKRLTISCLPI
jgi:hypothetical protein